MRALTMILMAAILVLAACTAPVTSDDVAASFEDENSDADVPENVDADEEDTEEVDSEDAQTDTEETEEQEDVVELDEESEYAAEISAVEGDLVALETRATDPDGDEVTLTFGEPLDENGEWQTQEGDAGDYEVTVVASDGQAETEATILIMVSPANGAPQISGPDVIEVQEGEEIDLGIYTIIDPDGDEFITSYAGWMTRSTYTTDFDDAGEHTVRIIAEDDAGNVAEQEVTIEVENVNRAPDLDVEDRRITVVEGELVEVEATADDADGDDVEITFEAPLDENGEWQTEEGDAGDYRVEVTANDGSEEDSTTVFITVEPANRPPVIEVDAVIRVEEGETIDFSVLADYEDPEGESLEVEYSGWMTEESYTTTFDDAGEYEVVITVSDGEQESEETVEIIVENVNRAPVFIRPA